MKNITKLIYLIVILNSVSHCASVTKIKFATVAPEGTTWMKTMFDFNESLKQETDGRVKFVFFPGGIAGDEKDVIRKMRYGKIHATGISGVGMGQIVPESRILDLPFFYDNASQVDKIHEELFDTFSEKFSKKGFKLISWSEIGWTYIFSNENIHSLDSLRRLKMWTWEGDQIALKTLQILGINPLSLSIGDVLTSLQTGLLNTVYTPPLAAVALQWNTKVKYVLTTPIVHASGAFLVTSKQWNKLSEADQNTFLRLGKKYFDQLTKDTRRENEVAMKDMIDKGMIEVKPDPELDTRFKEVLKEIEHHFTDKIYDKSLLEKITFIKNS